MNPELDYFSAEASVETEQQNLSFRNKEADAMIRCVLYHIPVKRYCTTLNLKKSDPIALSHYPFNQLKFKCHLFMVGEEFGSET